MNYFSSPPLAKYIEIGPNGDIVFELPSSPSLIHSAFIRSYYPIRTTREFADEYRSVNIPFQSQNRNKSKSYKKFSPELFYRTSNQDYGSYPPMMHSLPPIYRPLKHTFTDMLETGRDHHHLRNFNTNTKDLPSIWAPRGALPISIGRGSYVKRSLRPVFK